MSAWSKVIVLSGLVALAMGASSCRSLGNGQVYDSFNFPADGRVYGLRDQMDSNALTKVIILHGMSHGTPPEEGKECYLAPDASRSKSEIRAIMNRLAKGSARKPGIRISTKASRKFDQVRVYEHEADFVDPEEGVKKIVFFELNYAGYFAFPEGENPYGLTDSFPRDKRDLFELGAPLRGTGTRANDLFKQQLVTWGLSDAVTFMHPDKRAKIVDGMEKAFGYVENSREPGGYSVIAKSLGSLVMIEALAGRGIPAKSDERSIALNTGSVFLMANLAALVELGLSGDRHRFDRQLESAFPARKPGSRPVQLVAFSDADDPFTFPLSPLVRGGFDPGGNEQSDIQVVDVHTRNGTPFLGLWTGPFIEAHSGYLASKSFGVPNGKVIEMLVEGFEVRPE